MQRKTIFCSLSNSIIGTLECEFPLYGLLSELKTHKPIHPVFSFSRTHLLEKSKESFLKDDDSVSLFMSALINSVDSLIIDFPCLPTLHEEPLKFSLLELVTEIIDIDSKLLKLPKLRITKTHKFTGLKGWIDASRNSIKEFSETKLSNIEKDKLRKAQLRKAFLSSHLKIKINQTPKVLWDWIECQLAPRHQPFLKDWKKLFLKEIDDSKLPKYPPSYFDSVEEAFLCQLELGTSLSHLAFQRLKELKEYSKSFYDLTILDDSGHSIPLEVLNSRGVEPKRKDFKTDFEYFKALANWKFGGQNA